MTNEEAKKKVEEFVEMEVDVYDRKVGHCNEPRHQCEVCTAVFQRLKIALQNAILFALELAREAGPEKKTRLSLRDKPFHFDAGNWQGAVGEVDGFNAALTAKNNAIQGLIDEVKKGV